MLATKVPLEDDGFEEFFMEDEDFENFSRTLSKRF